MGDVSVQLLEAQEETNRLLRELLKVSKVKRRSSQKRQATIARNATKGLHVPDPILARQVRDDIARKLQGKR